MHISSLNSLTQEQRKQAIASLSDDDADQIFNDWTFFARDNQLAPQGDWLNWLILAGRGFGKTRTGAEWVRDKIKGGAQRVALVGPTAADTRDVMVEGESGILSVCWDKDRTLDGDHLGRPIYEPSKRQVTWANGAIAKLYSAEEPDRLRGPQHDFAWSDEIAAWARMQDTWDMLQFGLRLGEKPQSCVTTTPKPLKLIIDMIKHDDTAVTTGSTYDNAANLAPTFLKAIKERYENTRLGRQELHAEILDDLEGAVWNQDWIDQTRVDVGDEPDLIKLNVAVDPSGGGDAIGITAQGLGEDNRIYVLEDKTMGGSPEQWGRATVKLHDEFNADRVVVETNFGGDMAVSVIEQAAKDMHRKGARDSSSIKIVKVTASRGKVLRAEPVAALYEQGRVSHTGVLKELEAEMTSFTYDWDRNKDGSPNRLDSVVWGITDLMGHKTKSRRFATV